ncbi:DUF2889 domain-containing protein [Zwartia sp.]|uniref:DUF2889 domain-containing protein n=1 Tax=Zwartia sp. TaxID=2978004 RepID=UPI002719C804|nr:DUF2889 domain-containing protein [Zwartia sp.]MDO9023459.1 DUF2889 domain-containing protein [Zwartia sp.]
MPLPPTVEREEVHHRQIEMKAYRRSDGFYDIEGRVVDTKPFGFAGPLAESKRNANEPIHDIWVRLVIDEWFVIQDVVASSDATPFSICTKAPPTLSVLIGEKIGVGWTKLVRERLKGAASCTHMMELLGPMATTALQALWPVTSKRPQTLDANGRPTKIDSCFAYASQTEIIAQLWPEYYTGPKALAQPAADRPAESEA